MNPVGFRKPMTRARENPCPRLRAWVLMGTGAGCVGKPQGSPSYSLTVDYGQHHYRSTQRANSCQL